MPVHPHAQAIIDMLDSVGGLNFDSVTPQQARDRFLEMRVPIPLEPVGKIENLAITGLAGELPVRVYTPEGPGPFPALVWFHGGGWVLGDLEGADPTCCLLANAGGCVVISVDYRLAPEAKYPAAADDCFRATAWVAENAGTLGVDAARIAVGGDSAGGNLAAVVCQMARERGGPALIHQLLVYPVTDRDFTTVSYRDNADGYLLTRSSMEWFWDHYLNDPGEAANAYAAPLRAMDLAGLPSATVITAEFDPLRDEGEAYATKLRSAGVETTCTRYDGMIHGFFTMANALEDGRRAVAEAGKNLRCAFAAV